MTTAPAREADEDTTFLTVAERLAARPRRHVLALQTVRTLLRLGLTAGLAVLVARWLMGGDPGLGLPALVLGFVACAMIASYLADRREALAEAEVATALRHCAFETLAAMPARAAQAIPVGELVSGLQRHPDAVAALVVAHKTARIMMAVGPLCAAATLVAVSWQAALTVIGLTPVMIVFFALVGEAIRTRAEAREHAFGHLAGQFADRIRSLPTILANHALGAEADKLDERLVTHQVRTMGVLRIAFLNAGVLDFFSSLSIAILAVLLGLGHLGLATIPGFSGLALWQTLLILMVAPDYFAPFRRYAEQYHAKADGLAAAAALDRLFAARQPRGQATGVPAVTLPRRGLVAISGESGSGKSTLLRRLAGLEGDVPARRPFSWIATDAYVQEGTLAEAIAWRAPLRNKAWLLRAAGMVGLLDDGLLPGGLEARIAPGGANLSGGQRLRIAVARALLADGAVFADEPTAKLDEVTAGLVRDALQDMAATRLVVVASHDPALLRLARQRVELGRAASLAELETQ
jgi:ATP-binding cassette subfamily C protein